MTHPADRPQWPQPEDGALPPAAAPEVVEIFSAASSHGTSSAYRGRSAGSRISAGRARRRRNESLAIVVGACAVAIAAAAVVFYLSQPSAAPTVTIDRIPDQQVDELATLQISIPHQAMLRPGEKLRFALTTPIVGMNVDADSGRLTWVPSASQAARDYEVGVAALIGDKQVAQRRFQVTVYRRNRPPQITPIPEQTTDGSEPISFTITARDQDQPAREVRFTLLGGAPQEARLDSHTGRFEWQPTRDAKTLYRVTVAVEEQGEGGLSAKTAFIIRVKGGRLATRDSLADLVDSDAVLPEMPASPPGTPQPASSMPARSSTTLSGDKGTTRAALHKDAGDDGIVSLHRDRKLHSPREYAALRKLFADRFARKHDAEIKQGLGGDADAMQTWFDDHEEAKEELYMAVDEERDNLPRVFAVFNDLRKNFADPLADYWQLAIATAVVWDDEGAINNLEGLAQHAKATVPSGRLNAIENFKYLIDAEPVMQGRVQYSPWEFLTHVVNNKTPRDEREWALQTYLPPRAMIGRCYHDVPYDYVMFRTKLAQARLNGQLYMLPNLAQFGGVCAYQADYASRVAKSLGTPAESVEGTALDGEGHAWVMWVELSHMTPEHIGFTLQSHGRYRSHRYYVGTLRDPHTGQDITDRQMELRLHAVGSDVQRKRHADLTMRAYATVATQEELSVKDRFEFLAATLNLCPGSETAWRTVAQLAKENAGKKEYAKYVTAAIDQMFDVFAAFPDFTWEVFDELVSYDPNIRNRMDLHARLLTMYEKASRPDLASKACLKLVDYLVEDRRKIEAIAGLAHAIKAFPDEGTIVPPLLDRLESLCAESDGAESELVQFYADFLPLVPPTLDGRASPYCMRMLERGIARFKTAGQVELARAAELQLAKLKLLDRPAPN